MNENERVEEYLYAPGIKPTGTDTGMSYPREFRGHFANREVILRGDGRYVVRWTFWDAGESEVG